MSTLHTNRSPAALASGALKLFREADTTENPVAIDLEAFEPAAIWISATLSALFSRQGEPFRWRVLLEPQDGLDADDDIISCHTTMESVTVTVRAIPNAIATAPLEFRAIMFLAVVGDVYLQHMRRMRKRDGLMRLKDPIARLVQDALAVPVEETRQAKRSVWN